MKTIEAIAEHLVRKDPKEVAQIRAIHRTETGYLVGKKLGAGNVYDLIERAKTWELLETAQAVAVIATGWASPTDNDETPPSEHPKRRRVVLAIVVDLETPQIHSTIRFGDNAELIHDTSGNSTGALADAVQDLRKSLTTTR